MDRDYKTGKSDDVGVFSGLEIEHTPALGRQTLFLARNDLVFDQILQTDLWFHFLGRIQTRRTTGDKKCLRRN